MSTDLGLDPNDPLNLLLHNTSQSSDSNGTESEDGNVPDWSQFSSLWADVNEQSTNPTKQYADVMDFVDMSSIPTDMDFNPSITIEPSAMHYDSMKFPAMNYSYDEQYTISNELLAAQFPFTFQVDGSDMSGSSSTSSPQSSVKERRLSITSSSSSSGASLSPVPDSIPSPAPGYLSDSSVQTKEEPQVMEYTLSENDPAAELAQRVRESAGVMMAVPMQAHVQNYIAQMAVPNAQQKLPIPRHNRNGSSPSSQSNASTSSSSSAASTPPPSTPPQANHPLTINANTAAPLAPLTEPSPAVNTPTPSGPVPRPKTSHTTIERRYRTNLNARIQSLRMAVPALRVLEDREGGNTKKIKKNLKGGVLVKGTNSSIIDSEDGTTVDIIDERGFVDGVKVARKCSKANVLGKAVEYIRVLKKREQRLKAEQAGLKMLINGLVGGPALVREWEKEWRAKFGGEEKDEVEGEDEEGDEDDSEDDEGDDGDEEGRKRKRPKVAPLAVKKPADREKKKPAPAPVVANGELGQVPEKRKRGRPRKIVPPPVPLAPAPPVPIQQAPEPMTQDQEMYDPTQFASQWSQQQQQPAPQQYLLAVFALFSFFNSPLTSSSMPHAHHHTGTVLTAVHPPLAYAPDIVSQFVAPAPSTPPSWTWKEYVQIFHLAVSVLVLATFVGSWLGLNFGTGKTVARGRRMSVQFFSNPRVTKNGKLLVAGPAGWLKLGEECLLECRTSLLSFYEKAQIYRSIIRKKNTSASDLSTLALVLQGTTGTFRGLAHMKARTIWNRAQIQAEKAQGSRIYESLVFSELSLEEAFARLSNASPLDKTDGERAYTPLEVLGCLVVKDRLKKHLGTHFVNVVAAEDNFAKEDADGQDVAWRNTIEAARALGGHVEHLGKMFERVWKSGSVLDEADLAHETNTDSGVDGEIMALLIALVFYDKLFMQDSSDSPSSVSTLMSPPPSPSTKASAKRAQMLLALRTALGNRVFEDADLVTGSSSVEEDETSAAVGLEEAKDRVVDLIVDVERRERRSATP
ncbi:hypothetical protein CPC08DRAFT_682424 [Agrocybe pediades]|nr:hypothetical protein CPC08DRAFT_682424 [Agrocybe pediades]